MCAGVYREIVIEHSARPACRRVTALAVLRKTCSQVIGVGNRLVFLSMTGITVGGRSCIASAYVTTQALHGGVGARERKPSPAVVENSARPLARAVADLAIGRKPGRSMIGIGGLAVFSQMAADTAGVKTRILSVDMAGSAIHGDVRSRKREAGCRVVELGSGPPARHMTQSTIFREASCRVIGVGGSIECNQVTRGAIGRCSQETVVNVALSAADVDVHSGQWKLRRGAVVEPCSRPLGSGVASLTGFRESGGHMIRVGRLAKVVQMARQAVLSCSCEVVVNMTLQTGNVDVSARQREWRR